MEQPHIVRGRPRSRALTRVTYGLYRAASPPAPDGANAAARARVRREALTADLQAWSTLLRPTQCFTHMSSAIVRGWWLPPKLPAVLPIWIAQIGGRHASTRREARVISSRAITPSTLVEGVPLAVPAETLVSCAIDLGLLDLMILVDSALHSGDVTMDQLAEVAAQHRRGAPRLRQAVALADARSESAMETVLRILHVTCGIEVESQVEIRERGRFVARGDLRIKGSRTLHEYDGGEHLDVERQTSDLRRSRRLSDVGYVRRGYTALDIADQPDRIIREACRAAGKPYSPGLLAPWRELWDASTFSPLGRSRLRSRLTGPRTRRTARTTRPYTGAVFPKNSPETTSPEDDS